MAVSTESPPIGAVKQRLKSRPNNNLRRHLTRLSIVVLLGFLVITGLKLELIPSLIANHRSWLEDGYLGMLFVTSFYVLYMQATIKRKSKTNNAWTHVISGVAVVFLSLYGIAVERVWRISPGWWWCILTIVSYMANCLTVGPLMKYLRGPKHFKMLFLLGYDFVISFQGIMLIAWSYHLPILYWAVMPFWYCSIKKLAISADYLLALSPQSVAKEGSILGNLIAGSKNRLQGLELDTPTILFVILNVVAALFDNAYMAWYTYKGPMEFWAFAQAFSPEALRLALVKPAVGSLTISLVVFLGTLVQRRALPLQVGVWLNVILASVGPWIVLFWHKILAVSEPWFPEFMTLR